MRGIVKRLLGSGCVCALLIGVVGCSTDQELTFTDSQGTERTLSDYRGEVVVIGFSDSRCDPCRQAAEHMERLQERFGPVGVKVISVNLWDGDEPENRKSEHGYAYGMLPNGNAVAREYNVDRLPTFVVLGVDGRMIYRVEGFKDGTGEKIDRIVELHLARHDHDAYASHEE